MLLKRNIISGLAVLGLAATFSGCGGGNDSTGPGSSNALTAAQAQSVASSLFLEISRAWATVTPSTTGDVTAVSLASMPSTTYTINYTCTQGGKITGTYVSNSDLNSSGTGTVSGSLTTTAANCVVSTGTSNISVSGSLNYSYSVSYTTFKPSSDFVWRGTGSINWTGGSCTLDYTANANTATNHGSFSGTICGQSFSQTY